MPHQLTPPIIIDNVAHGRLSGTLEAVVLLVDISGFTGLTNRLMRYGTEGAEVLATVLVEIFAPLLHVVYHQGGFVATFGGDAFKAIFPIHQGPAPDAVYARAVVAAEQIRQYLIAHSAQTTRFGVFHFAGKVCLAGGVVEWGVWQGAAAQTIGGQQAAYYVEGAALDACMALDAYGIAGEVLLTQAVYAALPVAGALLQLEPVAEHWRLRAVAERYTSLYPPLPLSVPAAPGDLAAQFFSPELIAMSTQGEFRRVVTLFLNLQAAPQTLASAFQHTFFRLLAQYGGYLCRVSLSGSGQSGITLLLFWGAPISHENDVARALGFVQALQTASPVPLRAGVTTSLAYAGFVGSTLREEYTCYGTHVNLAVRQMTKAGWGEIWLDAETARQAQAAFAVTHHGQFAFKGFAAPQPVFLLSTRHDSIAAFYQGELIGRQAELAQLRAAIQPIFAGHFAGVILVTGEAGMGKSRLVHELQRQVADPMTRWQDDTMKVPAQLSVIRSSSHPVTLPQWFLCQTDEILRQSLNPFRYWLRSYFRQSPTQGEATNKHVFTAKLDDLLGDLRAISRVSHVSRLVSELDRTRSFLGALVDLYWPDSLYAQLEPQLRFENVLIALKTLIQAESLRRPVLLHLEDAQWLDGDSRTFLTHLTRNIEQFPLAVVITSRPPVQEGAAPIALVPPDVPQITIDLTVLSADAIRQLATDRLGGAPAPDLLALLSERAEGNPFFAEQLLLYLQEQDALAANESGWRLRDGFATSGLLPTDTRALLVARLDRLTAAVKEVVQTAAVLGREFAVQILSQMLRAQADLAERLKNAEEAAIWSALSEIRYLFKHTLLRDAAYDMQLRARLYQLHQLAAEALETIYAAALDSHAGEIAYHYETTLRYGPQNLQTQALHYLERAAQVARENYQNDTAIDYLRRALQITPAQALDDQSRLLLARSTAYRSNGDRAAQRQDLTALQALAARMNNDTFQAEVSLQWSYFTLSIGDYPTADASARECLSTAQRLQLRLIEMQCLENIGMVAYFSGNRADAHEPLLAALEIARAVNDHRNESRLLDELGLVAFNEGNLSAARDYHTHAWQVAETTDYLEGAGQALQHLGLVVQNQNDYVQARHCFTQALQLFRRIGKPFNISQALFFLGLADVEQGEYTTGGIYLNESIQLCRQVDDKRSLAMLLNNLGYLAFLQGDYSSAGHFYEESIDLSRKIRYRWCEGRALGNRGLLYHYQGEDEQAIVTCQTALQIAREIGNRSTEAAVLTFLGHALRRSKQIAEAGNAYQQALILRRQLNQPDRALEPLAGLAMIALSTNDLLQAQNLLTELLPNLLSRSLDGMHEPFWVYLTCYQILQAGQDAQSQTLLATAHDLLQRRAAKIADNNLRRSFLENVPANRAILEEFTRLHPAGITAPAPS